MPSGPRSGGRPRRARCAYPCAYMHPRQVPGRTVLDVVGAAERAWETLSGALGLGTPDVDADDLAYHVYLVEGAAEPGVTRVSARDVRSRIESRASLHRARRERSRGVSARCARRARDRASRPRARRARDRGGNRARADDLPRAAHGAVRGRPRGRRRAGLPVTTGARGVRRARLRGRDLAGRRARGQSRRADAFMEGAALFWGRIDWAFGRAPASIVMASWALAPTMTDVGASDGTTSPTRSTCSA